MGRQRSPPDQSPRRCPPALARLVSARPLAPTTTRDHASRALGRDRGRRCSGPRRRSDAEGSHLYAIVGGAVTFSSVVAAGFRRRADVSRRIAESDGGPGLPGFICLPDRLVIRYPDAVFQLPRSKLAAIVRRDRPHAAGDSGMAEYEMRAEIDVGGKGWVELTIAEVVDVTGHAERADIDARMATLLVLVEYREQTWRRGIAGAQRSTDPSAPPGPPARPWPRSRSPRPRSPARAVGPGKSP